MHILKVGLNYKTAPVEIREKLTFSEAALDQASSELKNRKSILENVIISTCNRTEIYAVVDQLHTGRYYIKQFLADWFKLEKETFSPYLQIVENDGAVEHLFRVSAGLDSMVLGETQILGQVRDSFLQSQKISSTGTVFNELFKQAITFGKRAHRDTGIGEHAVSISYAAVELAKNIFGNLNDKHVGILGAGKMGELAAKNLHGSGVEKITVINRTVDKAKELAGIFEADAVGLDQLEDVLSEVDILISSTGSNSVIITKELMESVQSKRDNDQPIVLIDIAVPRDIEAEVNELKNVHLYDIDDLQGIVDDNLEARKEAAEQIEMNIEHEIVTFKEWLKTLGVVPVISALRNKALSIQQETMKSIERKMPDLTEREKKVLNKHTKSIINQLLKEPITQAKEMAGGEHADHALELFIEIFGIEKEVVEEFHKQAQKDQTLSSLQKNEYITFPPLEKISNAN